MTEIEAYDAMAAVIYAGPITGIAVAQITFDGIAYTPDPEVAYIKVTIDIERSNQHSFGKAGETRSFRREGGITVQCRVPAADGAITDALTIAMEVKNLFEGNTLSTIRFSNAVARRGSAIETEWLQANAEVDFSYDEIK